MLLNKAHSSLKELSSAHIYCLTVYVGTRQDRKGAIGKWNLIGIQEMLEVQLVRFFINHNRLKHFS